MTNKKSKKLGTKENPYVVWHFIQRYAPTYSEDTREWTPLPILSHKDGRIVEEGKTVSIKNIKTSEKISSCGPGLYGSLSLADAASYRGPQEFYAYAGGTAYFLSICNLYGSTYAYKDKVKGGHRECVGMLRLTPIEIDKIVYAATAGQQKKWKALEQYFLKKMGVVIK